MECLAPLGRKKGTQLFSTIDLKYDAWNRLVKVMDGQTVVTASEYDGLGQRVRRTAGSDTYDYYYNDRWQLLTEVKGSEKTIYHWHPHYIDALAARTRGSTTHTFLHDANFNVTAAVSSSGSVVERYAFLAPLLL